MPDELVGVIHDRRHPACDGIGNEVTTVACRAAISEKGCAVLCFPAARCDVNYLRWQGTKRFGQPTYREIRCRFISGRHERFATHQPRSFTLIADGTEIALASRVDSTSGATPDSRSACDMTFEKTGAETSPPKCFPAEGSSMVTAMM